MNQFLNKKLVNMGFVEQIETLFSLTMKDKLNTTSRSWDIYAYFENGKYYFSNNGELVSSFDTPDIDIEYILKKIKLEIAKYGCHLNTDKIVKEIDLNNIEKDMEDFIKAVRIVDKMYSEL